MKTFKKLIKFLVVVAAPVTSVFFYVYNIQELFSLNVPYIILWHLALVFVLYNALFYSYHMSKTTILSRFHISLVTAFGFFVAYENTSNIQILIGCIGIEFNYKGLFTKEKPKGNFFKPENRI